MDYSNGKLSLQECSCRTHGQVYLALSDRSPGFVARVYSKADACEVLERYVGQGLPEQLEFEAQVAAASWLQGEMPVKL